MSSNFASKRSCLQEITLCSDKNRLYGSARAKPGNLVFRRLLTARNERQVRINLINIAKGTLLHCLQMEGRGGNANYVKLITFSLHFNIQVPGYYP